MGYQVLSNPAGTLGYKPKETSAFEQIFQPMAKGFGKSLGQGLTSSVYKKAAEREGLTPKYEIGADGTVKTTFSKPTTKDGNGLEDIKKKTKAFIAGIGGKEDYGFETDEEMEAAREKLRKEISADKYLKNYFGVKDEEEKEVKPNWEQDARDAMSGKITFEDLALKWPTKDPEDIENMKLTFQSNATKKEPIEKSSKFEQASDNIVGKIGSAFSKDKAQISKATQKVIDGIKTQGDYEANIKVLSNINSQEDINELLSNKAGYEKAGVNVDAIVEGADLKALKEYFGRR